MAKLVRYEVRPPAAVLTLARQARDTLHGMTRVLEPAPDRLLSPVAAA